MRDGLQTRAAALGSCAAAMWLVRVIDFIVPGPGSAAGHGIIPRTVIGLQGIVAAPFIHIDFEHLVSNTIPFLILGTLVLLRGVGGFLFVVVTTALIAGVGTWLFGAGGTQHVGASGIVFGLFGYLLFRSAFDRRLSSLLITLAVAVVYGTAMLWSLVPAQGISWSGHLFGFAGGVVAARLRYSRRRAGVAAGAALS